MQSTRIISTILAMTLWLGLTIQQSQAQEPTSPSSKPDSAAEQLVSSSTLFARISSSTLFARTGRGRPSTFVLMPFGRYASAKNATGFAPMAAPNIQVLGSGTLGRLTKWTGLTSSNSVIDDSTIFEDKFGKVGIGTDTPTSRFTVAGMIETTLGGLKFPDGTVQLTAAVSGLQSVIHNSTLAGEGTANAPLGVGLPLRLVGGVSAPNGLVTILNSTTAGNGALVSGGPSSSGSVGGFGLLGSGGDSNEGGIAGVGLTGEGGRVLGGSGSPGDGVRALGGFTESADGGPGGTGVRANGGFSREGAGGDGVFALGGTSQRSVGGIGVRVIGGASGGGSGPGATGLDATGGEGFFGTRAGGTGIRTKGGHSNFGNAGDGLAAIGGDSDSGASGNGASAIGGTNLAGFGGHGVVATGGDFNGRGVVATGGVGPVGHGVEATGGASTGSGSTAGAGVLAKGGPSSGSNSESGFGIIAVAGDASNGAMRGRAGHFEGDVFITENLTVAGNLDVQGAKHFKIDHPLDPENKYLLHASVESSEVLNLYSGNAVTDANGEALVNLPDWFEALNSDLRYQLTVIGTFAQAIVSQKVKQHRFTIRTNLPNVEVSWQVTGVRSDAAMRKSPFKAEENKPDRERGTYLDPKAYDKPNNVERGRRETRE